MKNENQFKFKFNINMNETASKIKRNVIQNEHNHSSMKRFM